jgi:hypothetical protein
MIAGVIAAVLMSAGLMTGTAATAGATYGAPKPPAAAKHVIKDVNKVVKRKGKISKKRAKHLIGRVKLARQYGLISPKTAKKLIKKIKKDTRK